MIRGTLAPMKGPWREEDGLPREACVVCGEEHPVAARTPEGGALCQVCWRAALFGTCADCGEERVIQVRADGVTRCRPCEDHHNRVAHPRRCVCCGAQTRRKLWDQTPVCEDCRSTPAELRCSSCGAKLSTRAGGPPVKRCDRCRPDARVLKDECELCGAAMPRSRRRIDGRRACVWCALEHGKSGPPPRTPSRHRQS